MMRNDINHTLNTTTNKRLIPFNPTIDKDPILLQSIGNGQSQTPDGQIYNYTIPAVFRILGYCYIAQAGRQLPIAVSSFKQDASWFTYVWIGVGLQIYEKDMDGGSRLSYSRNAKPSCFRVNYPYSIYTGTGEKIRNENEVNIGLASLAPGNFHFYETGENATIFGDIQESKHFEFVRRTNVTGLEEGVFEFKLHEEIDVEPKFFVTTFKRR